MDDGHPVDSNPSADANYSTAKRNLLAQPNSSTFPVVLARNVLRSSEKEGSSRSRYGPHRLKKRRQQKSCKYCTENKIAPAPGEENCPGIFPTETFNFIE